MFSFSIKYLAFNHHSRIYSTLYYVALNYIETYFVEFCRHHLRHYPASIQHALGIPDAYIMQAGGWGNDRVLKEVYRHTLEDTKQKMSNVAINYFETMQHDMQHDIKKHRNYGAFKTGDERIELPPKVLETPIIPFDQSPKFIKMTYKIRHLLYIILAKLTSTFYL